MNRYYLHTNPIRMVNSPVMILYMNDYCENVIMNVIMLKHLDNDVVPK